LPFVHYLCMFNIIEQPIIMNRPDNAGVANMNDKEQEILRQAIAALELATKTQIEIGPMEWAIPPQPPMTRPDAYATIKLAEKELTYIAEVKATITPAVLENLIINRGAYQRRKLLLVTQYLPPQYIKILRERGIPFIDTAGNVYINEPPIHIDIQGKRLEEMKWPQLAEKGILRQAGLRVVYALLIKNELANMPFREIAEAAGVALGTVDRVFKDMRRRNFIVERDHDGRMLTKKRELIDWWVNAYAEKLRPKLLIGRYETDNYEQFQNEDITKLNAQWGGEMAAGIITNYLKPEVFTIYAHKPNNDLILRLKLRDRPTGRIEIRERFWNIEDNQRSKRIVHPILVYADLLATQDPRNIDTAKLIYDAIVAMEN
jgi:hypothetical protein